MKGKLYIVLIVIVYGAMNFYVNYKPIEVRKDAVMYHCIAEALSANSSTIINDNPVYAGRDIGEVVMPGYPFLVSILYRIFGVNYLPVILFQILLTLAGVILFYYILKHLTGANFAVLATLWLITYRPMIRTAASYYLENCAIWMLLILLYFIFRFYRDKQYVFLYLYAIAFAILISFNNRFIFHFGVAGIFMLVQYIRIRLPRFIPLVITGLIVLVFLVPWHIRQYNTYNQFVVFSPFAQSYTSGKGDPQLTDVFWSFPDIKDYYIRNALSKKSANEVEKNFTPEVYNKMKKNQPLSGLAMYTARVKGFFSLYRIKNTMGFGKDTRPRAPNVTKRKVLFGWLYIFLLIASFVIHTYIKSKTIKHIVVGRIVLVGISILVLPVFIKSTDLINLGILFIFLMPGIYYAIKKGNQFVVFCVVLLVAHIILHSYTHFITRYRLTILPALFIVSWYGISEVYYQLLNFFSKRTPKTDHNTAI